MDIIGQFLCGKLKKRQETAVGVMPEPPVDLELTWKCTILNSEPTSSITKVLTHTFKENEKKKKGPVFPIAWSTLHSKEAGFFKNQKIYTKIEILSWKFLNMPQESDHK